MSADWSYVINIETKNLNIIRRGNEKYQNVFKIKRKFIKKNKNKIYIGTNKIFQNLSYDCQRMLRRR